MTTAVARTRLAAPGVALVLAACGTAAPTTPAAEAGGASASATSTPSVPASDPGPTDPSAAARLPRLGAAPALTGLDGWLQNGDVTGLDDLRGSVVVLQFWTFGCVNCKHTLPNLQALRDRHADDDLAIVGVHAPEFEYEKDPDAIAAAAAELDVTWPIALDTDTTSFRAWQGDRRYWPRTYVLDQAGQIRFDHVGEGAYGELNATVAALLADPVA